MRLVGYAALAGYVACLPIANWLIGHVGTVCIPNEVCLIPVWPGLTAPSGVVMIGVALVLRDIVQRLLGTAWGLVAIAIGAAVSFAIAPAALVVASVTSFIVSELTDFAVYTPLQRKNLFLAVFASSCVGIVVDSGIFLWIAFDSFDFLYGQIVGKIWGIVSSYYLIVLVRRYTTNVAK